MTRIWRGPLSEDVWIEDDIVNDIVRLRCVYGPCEGVILYDEPAMLAARGYQPINDPEEAYVWIARLMEELDRKKNRLLIAQEGIDL